MAGAPRGCPTAVPPAGGRERLTRYWEGTSRSDRQYTAGPQRPQRSRRTCRPQSTGALQGAQQHVAAGPATCAGRSRHPHQERDRWRGARLATALVPGGARHLLCLLLLFFLVVHLLQPLGREASAPSPVHLRGGLGAGRRGWRGPPPQRARGPGRRARRGGAAAQQLQPRQQHLQLLGDVRDGRQVVGAGELGDVEVVDAVAVADGRGVLRGRVAVRQGGAAGLQPHLRHGRRGSGRGRDGTLVRAGEPRRWRGRLLLLCWVQLRQVALRATRAERARQRRRRLALESSSGRCLAQAGRRQAAVVHYGSSRCYELGQVCDWVGRSGRVFPAFRRRPCLVCVAGCSARLGPAARSAQLRERPLELRPDQVPSAGWPGRLGGGRALTGPQCRAPQYRVRCWLMRSCC
jgi:hypothetical protein